MKTQYQVVGMTCQACATRLEKVLNKREDIILAEVNFATEVLQVEWVNPIDGDSPVFDDLKQSVVKLGFDLAPVADIVPKATDTKQHIKQIITNFLGEHWLLMCLTLPFVVGMLGMLLGTHALMPPVWLQFVLASVVQFWVARHFYARAWASIRGRLANMDVLVVLGTLAIWLYSSWVFLQSIYLGTANHQLHVYFEAGVMIIALMSLGKFLEKTVKKEGLDSIRLLLALMPSHVQFQDEHGIRKLPIQKAKVGEVAFVKVHDRVALDGVVVSGTLYCDESYLTGESKPVAKRVGDRVVSGAMVVSGTAYYRIEADYQHSYLKRLADELAQAQGSKSSLASIADKVVGVFVPAVAAVALLTFGLNVWWVGVLDVAFMRAVAVLVIACPCALGLATPTAIMAGMGVAARHGVWFKDAQSLELSGKIDTVVFDKTGTLTQGKLTLAGSSMPDGKRDVNEILSLAASLEQHANHPLAEALVSEAKQRGLKFCDVKQSTITAGAGIAGQVSLGDTQVSVAVGKPDFVNYPKSLIPTHGTWAISSLVAVAIDGVAVAVFAFADTIKDDGQVMIDKLKDEQMLLVMMSGDKSSVVAHVAKTLGLDNFLADLSPQDKAAHIANLQAQGHKVAMIGDGINDVLATAQADASFAVANATDIAKHSSAAVLRGDSLMGVYYAHRIAKRTVATIYQNLFFAFIYNVIGIPLAAVGLLNPMLAAGMMTLSSLSVVINALWLKRLKLSDG